MKIKNFNYTSHWFDQSKTKPNLTRMKTINSDTNNKKTNNSSNRSFLILFFFNSVILSCDDEQTERIEWKRKIFVLRKIFVFRQWRWKQMGREWMKKTIRIDYGPWTNNNILFIVTFLSHFYSLKDYWFWSKLILFVFRFYFNECNRTKINIQSWIK